MTALLDNSRIGVLHLDRREHPATRQGVVGPAMFSAVAVEMDAANRIFTALPVFPVPGKMDQE